MTKLLTIFFVSLFLAAYGLVFASVPEKFAGTWMIRAETAPGFPWWDQVKYPVILSVTKDSAEFEDQMGFACAPKAFFYDDELDAVVFKHCLQTKSDTAFAPYYKIWIVDDQLKGEVWTYKLLFRLQGKKSQSKSEHPHLGD